MVMMHRFPGEPIARTGPLDPNAVTAPPLPVSPAWLRHVGMVEAITAALEVEGIIDLRTDELDRLARTLDGAFRSLWETYPDPEPPVVIPPEPSRH